MALIHWWPLNGDLIDKIGGVPFTGTLTTDAAGKIGNCAKQHGARLTANNTLLANNIDFSVAMWVKYSNVASSVAWNDLFGFEVSNGTITEPMRMEVIANGSGDFRIFSNNISGNQGGYCGLSLTKEAWTHLVFVKKGKILTVYKNGSSSGIAVASVNSFEDTYATGEFHIGDSAFYASYNDIRLYDHALSQAEVKELSKALVVHYAFNDTLAEPTINLLPSSLQNKYVENNADAAYYTITSGLTASAYTLSANIKRHLGDQSPSPYVSLFVTYSDGTSENITTTTAVDGYDIRGTADGQFHYYKITVFNASKKAVTQVNGWILDRGTYTSGTPRYMTIQNAQLEAKDHATPYTPTERVGTVTDESGNGHHAVIYNSDYSSDTASGTLSLHTPRVNPSSINTIPSSTNSAFAFADIWGTNYTPDEFTVAWWWKVMDWGYGTGPFGLVIGNGDYMNSTLGVHDGVIYLNFAGGDTRVGRSFTECGTGAWRHFALTFKPGSYTTYVDGVKLGTSQTNASLTLDPWRYIYLGAGGAGGCLRDGDIYWGDFRYYSTALSEDDIYRLYRTKAYVTDQGDFCAGEFNEHADKARVKENYVAECSSLSDGLPNGYARLEYLESNGKQFIDTGFVPNQDTRVRAEIVLPIANATQACFGCRVSSGDIQYQFVTQGDRYRTDYNLTYVYMTPTSTYAPTGKIFVDKNKNYTNINNDYSHTHTYGTFTAPDNLYVFATNAKDKDMDAYAKATMKLYDMQIYDNGKLIRNYFPSINPSGVPGLYDTVNSVFYASKTSTPFIAGPILMTGKASLLEDGGIGGREIIEV